MELVSVHYTSAADFLSAYSTTNGKPSLFYRTKRDDLTPGTSVLAEVNYDGLPNHLLLRCVIGEARADRGFTLWPAPLDRGTLQFAVQFATGEIEIKTTYPRSGDRFPTTLPVDCRVEGKNPIWMASQTEDLSTGGVFIRSRQTPAIGSRVRLVIGPSKDGERFLVYGKVAWSRSGGFGVRFSTRGHTDARRLRTHLRRSAQAGKVAFA
ncbi:MAG: PilZ domain-containing protein [Deltaproteobacteria bacterium]|jgi:Tfp pilus assembly protein PilZ|nr:PilZ domain-containing protein [Deltaproteobacteria bacterium]